MPIFDRGAPASSTSSAGQSCNKSWAVHKVRCHRVGLWKSSGDRISLAERITLPGGRNPSTGLCRRLRFCSAYLERVFHDPELRLFWNSRYYAQPEEVPLGLSLLCGDWLVADKFHGRVLFQPLDF